MQESKLYPYSLVLTVMVEMNCRGMLKVNSLLWLQFWYEHCVFLIHILSHFHTSLICSAYDLRGKYFKAYSLRENRRLYDIIIIIMVLLILKVIRFCIASSFRTSGPASLNRSEVATDFMAAMTATSIKVMSKPYGHRRHFR